MGSVLFSDSYLICLKRLNMTDHLIGSNTNTNVLELFTQFLLILIQNNPLKDNGDNGSR